MHWATGIGWGVLYGALASTTSRLPWARALALGPAVWLSGYVVLPLAKVYKPIWEYDARTLRHDLVRAHRVRRRGEHRLCRPHEEAPLSTASCAKGDVMTSSQTTVSEPQYLGPSTA